MVNNYWIFICTKNTPCLFTSVVTGCFVLPFYSQWIIWVHHFEFSCLFLECASNFLRRISRLCMCMYTHSEWLGFSKTFNGVVFGKLHNNQSLPSRNHTYCVSYFASNFDITLVIETDRLHQRFSTGGPWAKSWPLAIFGGPKSTLKYMETNRTIRWLPSLTLSHGCNQAYLRKNLFA